MHATPAAPQEGRHCCAQRSAPDEFLCPICLEVITEAAWLVHTRQLFDRSCLIQWFEHGGRTCPATGLALPAKVRMRAAPDLQAKILLWAAEHGLEVPGAPAAQGLVGAPAAGCEDAAPRPRLLKRLRRKVKKALKQLGKALSSSSKLYPELAAANWANHVWV